MGDIIFVIKMIVYTLVLIILLQVKIGPTTLEQKLYEFTHQSQMAGVAQSMAQGAARFIGVQYNNLTGHIKSDFINQHGSAQRPGERLQNKIIELKESINKNWKEHSQKTEESLEQ